MLRSILIGLDGSAYSTTAVELGLRWAQRSGALLVGLGIVDAPTIREPEPVPIGGTAYKTERDEILVAEARQRVHQLLEHFTQRCAEVGVACASQEDVGRPAERILLQAQQCDLILLGQQTHFHFVTQEQADETLRTVLKSCPRPVVAVPATLPEGSIAVVAYDGSLQAARTVQAFQAVAPPGLHEVHVVCVHPQQSEAIHCVERAVEFLRRHDVAAHPHAMATSMEPAEALLEYVQHVHASLLVMGAYGQPTLREFLFGSVTTTMLETSPVPLFVYH